MTKFFSALAALLLVVSFTGAGTASADLASAKATVVAAKAQGVVGEQADGYLGFVGNTEDPATHEAVNEINAGRAELYRETAQKTGVTPEAAAEAAAKVVIERLPPGQFYKPLGGGWTKK
jgi:uncharacterized protein YdbL (DUF1318 family)